MSRRLWEVIGRSSEGGIVVRRGESLSSKEEPGRLGTGSIIREIRLEGDRLQFERISGVGPISGWVSARAKGHDLVVRTVKERRALPVVACFYSSVDSRQGRTLLQGFMHYLKMAGLPDFFVGDHCDDECYSDCKDFDEYTTRLVSKLDEAYRGRPVFVVGHSHGAVPAWGTALKLGSRCLKLYLLSRRAPSVPMLDEVFGVDGHDRVSGLDDYQMLSDMLEAWPNEYTQNLKDQADQAQVGCAEPVLEAIGVIKRQLSSAAYPTGSRDLHHIIGGEKSIAIKAPIMVLAAGKEAKQRKGETLAKLLPWRDFTQRKNSFQLVLVPGVNHMSIMWASSPALGIVLSDMRKRLGSHSWMQKEARWLSKCAPQPG